MPSGSRHGYARIKTEKARDAHTGFQQFVDDMVTDEDGDLVMPENLDVSVQPKALRRL